MRWEGLVLTLGGVASGIVEAPLGSAGREAGYNQGLPRGHLTRRLFMRQEAHARTAMGGLGRG